MRDCLECRGTVVSAKYRNPCIFTINALCGNKEIIPIKKVIKDKKKVK